MGIDFGEKRVGIASTDESGSFSLPRVVLPNDDTLMQEALTLIKNWGIERVVMGESKNFKGEDNDIMEAARAFADRLRKEGVQVAYHNEVLSSLEAKQLQGENEMLDASAAAIILKSYIDTTNNDKHR